MYVRSLGILHKYRITGYALTLICSDLLAQTVWCKCTGLIQHHTQAMQTSREVMLTVRRLSSSQTDENTPRSHQNWQSDEEERGAVWFFSKRLRGRVPSNNVRTLYPSTLSSSTAQYRV